jgi:hypothetical protein
LRDANDRAIAIMSSTAPGGERRRNDRADVVPDHVDPDVRFGNARRPICAPRAPPRPARGRWRGR